MPRPLNTLLAALALVIAAAVSPAGAPAPQAVHSYDVVVYGGTAGGVIAAVAAAREGAHVALLEPHRHVGGMVSGGLGWTDYGKQEVIGGYSRDFFVRVGQQYGQPIAWHFEPHVAEDVFRALIKEAGVDVFFQHRLREKAGVTKEGTRVTRISLENGATFAARIFIDASYEGDLMAQAHVSYTWGREGSDQYGESLAGVRDRTPLHQFTVPVRPYDANGRLLADVSAAPKAASGSADRKVQAYNFRVCMTNAPENRVPFPEPCGYEPGRYALLANMLQAMDANRSKPWTLTDVMKPDPIPHDKTDTNNNGAVSTDDIGASYEYPEATYVRRKDIWDEHTFYQQGFFYFLQHDPSVPQGLHEAMAPWGLCKDEFVDTNHWPHQLYIREARRMVGAYVMTQRDIQTDLTKPDSIGMGSYSSDSHNVQRIVNAQGLVENEGDMQVPVRPYQIPYRVMLPKQAQATNLLVPVCFSASHVAYSTLRMEPQYMIIGQAAGVAAKLAIDAKVPVQQVDVQALRSRLQAQRAVLEAGR